MRFWWVAASFAILLIGATGHDSEMVERMDLDKLLNDRSALEKLVIEYDPSRTEVLFVYGTGIVIRQTHSAKMSDNLVPTCKGKVDPGEIEGMLRAMIARHFFDLPSRSFYFVTASDDGDDFWNAVKLHSIFLDDGQHRASRAFAAGVYDGRQEAIPPDFAAIENILQKISHEATDGKACGFAPGIRLPRPEYPQPKSSLPS